MFSNILIADRGEIACPRRARRPRPHLRRGIAILLIAGAAGPAVSAMPTPTADAALVIAAFDQICLRTGFSAQAVEEAFERHGWKGVRVQRPTESVSASAWSFGFGEIRVGQRMMGPGLTSFSCELTLKEEAAPPGPVLKEELKRHFAPARLQPARGWRKGLGELMRLKDEPEEQAEIYFSADRVPFRRAGTFELGKGVLIHYGELRGPYAKQAAKL